MSDELWRRIFSGYTITNATTTTFVTPPASAYIPPTAIDAIPSDHSAMVETLNQRLLYGRMSPTMRTRLLSILNSGMVGAEHRRKVLNLIHLISISPEFVVQI
jgi:hypothetical protein